ncbi:VOC family protein [Zavarzinia sp. CC-PAN008]|uniref:VOC family protein n=1 Tax=Zavarzinia sp. CC-PAN008 TaxID=3243332 RepID=UPI003F74951A
MLSHIYLGTNDPARAEAFYAPILALLGWRLRFSDATTGWAGWEPADAARPLFIVGRPYDREPASPSNGGMVALLAPDRPTVDAVFAMALRGGALDQGEPGLRPHYHAHYYGAYFRDLDGNKVCVCCHHAPAQGPSAKDG